MSALSEADGRISKQSASYRQGLVLGLTMAEVMILLVFCLLIALASFLKTERDKRLAAEKQLHEERKTARVDRDFVDSVKKDPRLAELLKQHSVAGDQGKLDEYWRELVEGASVVATARRAGLTASDVRSHMAAVKAIKEKKVDLNKVSRDAAIAASVDNAVLPAGSATPAQVAMLIERGLAVQAPNSNVDSSGHKWPPIIALNDANGKFFKSGSAELDPAFQKLLLALTAPHIAELVKQYNVDVIEVVGHTDEQPIGVRSSNLDRDLVSVLSKDASIAGITPADNAGLGLARAVSVVRILRQSRELAGYKILPLSGGQLINTDETLALGDNPGDVRERRRIEIRLRKATPHLLDQPAPTNVQKRAEPIAGSPMPPLKPVKDKPTVRAVTTRPTQITPLDLPPPVFVRPQP